MRLKVTAKLRESLLLARYGRGVEFTQPRLSIPYLLLLLSHAHEVLLRGRQLLLLLLAVGGVGIGQAAHVPKRRVCKITI